MADTYLFVCEHGAAKSIVAAALFNRAAKQNGLDVRAIARGTDPDEALTAAAVSGLSEDGLTATEEKPALLENDEAAQASRIFSFSKLPDRYQTTTPVEIWDEVPPVSKNYQAARDAIKKRIEKLIQEIEK